jgi:hypothetical protein
MQDRDYEFFRPLWRRIALALLLVAWTAWEWSNGESLWGTIVGGAAAYVIWAYLIAFPASGPGEDGKPQDRLEE